MSDIESRPGLDALHEALTVEEVAVIRGAWERYGIVDHATLGRLLATLTASALRADAKVEVLLEEAIGILASHGGYGWTDALALIQQARAVLASEGEGLDVERLALKAFDETMKEVEPWASGPVWGKHRGLFARAFAARLRTASTEDRT